MVINSLFIILFNYIINTVPISGAEIDIDVIFFHGVSVIRDWRNQWCRNWYRCYFLPQFLQHFKNTAISCDEIDINAKFLHNFFG